MSQLYLGFLILFLVVLSSANDKAKPIRFTVVESWPEPYAFFDSERNLTGGAMKDIMEEIGKRVNSPIEFVYLSRNRVDAAMEKGTADVRCYANEAWAIRPELYIFTQPIFQTSNSIVWKKGRKPIQSMNDIQDKTIGTVSGYIYKNVDTIFKAGKAKRADVTNENMNVTLLQKNRINYAVVETTSFNWSLRKKSGVLKADNVDSFLIDSLPVKCAVLKKNSERFKIVEAAIDKMKQEGIMKTIESKYGLK